jgi:hypothetical protein
VNRPRDRRGRKPPEAPKLQFREIVAAFTAVGVSRPVDLDAELRRELRAVLDGWEEMPDGLVELRDALAEE